MKRRTAFPGPPSRGRARQGLRPARRQVFIGADLGGTWLRVEAVDRSGRLLSRGTLPAPDPSLLAPVLHRFLRRRRLTAAAVVVGSTGVGDRLRRRVIARRLAALAPRVVVMTDLELAWRAAFGACEGPGILVVGGTGSAAYGRDSRGREARAGGLGSLLGDEGSAFWIGREWLRRGPPRRALSFARRPDAVAAVAALARGVLRRARGDPKARRIVAEAQAELVRLAVEARRALGLRGETPICGHGGLFRGAWFRGGFVGRLRRSGGSWRWREAPARPESAAAHFGRMLP